MRRRDHELTFAAVAQRPPLDNYTAFTAFLGERREGMRIVRYSYAGAKASSFLFDFGKGTASVGPPWPFQGSARFRRGGPDGHNSWAGSLRVRMLGIDPIDLAAPGFWAALKPEIPYDE